MLRSLYSNNHIKTLPSPCIVLLRMDEAAWKDWISSDVDSDKAKELISQNRGSELVSYRVNQAVNKQDAQGPYLIDPI